MDLQKTWPVGAKATKLANWLEVDGRDYTSEDSDGRKNLMDGKLLSLGIQERKITSLVITCATGSNSQHMHRV